MLAHSSKDLGAIDSAMEKINEAWKVASEEMYKATEEAKAANGADTGQQDASSSDDVTDVDFEEVDDDLFEKQTKRGRIVAENGSFCVREYVPMYIY